MAAMTFGQAPGEAPESAAAGAEEYEECIICFESLAFLGGPVQVPCNCRVAYCHKCWDRALAASMSANGKALCPSCRTPMHVDFDSTQGRLQFSRAPLCETSGRPLQDNWRRRLYQQARPMQIRLLQSYGAQRASASGDAAGEGGGAASGVAADAPSTRPDGDPEQVPPRCVCGHRLRQISARQRVETYIAEETPVQPTFEAVERLMLNPPIVCDLCDQMVGRGSQVWTCENGRRTVLHAVAYDVCEACFMLHAHGVEVSGAGSEAASGGGEDDEDCSDVSDSAMEDEMVSDSDSEI